VYKRQEDRYYAMCNVSMPNVILIYVGAEVEIFQNTMRCEMPCQEPAEDER
jgi:hypothetical protein